MVVEDTDVITTLHKAIIDLKNQHKIEVALKEEKYETEMSRVTKTYEGKLSSGFVIQGR